MFNWIRNYLFPPYTLKWDFYERGIHLKGSDIYDSKRVAKWVADSMNAMYKPGTYWVTDKDGNII